MNHKISNDLRLSDKEVKALIKRLRTLGVAELVDFHRHCHRCGVQPRYYDTKYCKWCYRHVKYCMNRDEYLEPWPRRTGQRGLSHGGDTIRMYFSCDEKYFGQGKTASVGTILSRTVCRSPS